MWEFLCNKGINYKWTDCELLHEFLEKYQIKYINPFDHVEEERVVWREEIRRKGDDDRRSH